MYPQFRSKISTTKKEAKMKQIKKKNLSRAGEEDSVCIAHLTKKKEKKVLPAGTG